MATITYAKSLSDYAFLGEFFQPNNLNAITSGTKSQLIYENPGPKGTTVTVTGAGFEYLDGVPTDGEVKGIEVRQGAKVLVTISGIDQELTSFFYNAFGWDRDNGPHQSGDGFSTLGDIFGGNDVVNGSGEADDFSLGLNEGNDRIRGNGGDDFISGDRGNDTIIGGDGTDVLSFEGTHFGGAGVVRGLVLDLAAGTLIDPWGNSDQVSEVENFRGSKLSDTIRGTAGDDNFMGLRGADEIDCRGAPNTDYDVVRYDKDSQFGGNRGIVANFLTDKVRDGFGTIDTVHNAEEIRGTRFSDTFIGGGKGETNFVGLDGADKYQGAGSTFDSIDLSGGDKAVVVDMNRATGQIRNDGFGNVESYTGDINAFFAGDANDTLTGNAKGNNLVGQGGDDRVSGGGGDDQIRGGEGADTLTGGAGKDEFLWRRDRDGFDKDVVTDFKSGQDVVGFRFRDFDGMDGTVRFNLGNKATHAGSSFFFNTVNDTLSWDRDGTGNAFDAVKVVTLTGVNTFTADDIFLH